MDTHSTDRSARVMAAAISRRRALKGAAGAAALGLAGRRRRARGATIVPGSDTLLDLPRAVLRPADLPDGERFGLVGGVSFRGAAGGEQSRTLDERRLTALESAREALVGGHSVTLVPLTGPTDAWWTITHHQLTDIDLARTAYDGYRTIYFAGTEEVTPEDDPASYYWWTLPHQDGFVTTRAVLFQTQTVVTTVLGMTRHETEPPAPSTAEVVEPLNELTKVSTGRLELVLNNDYAGLATTLPTWTQVAAATEGRLGPPITWWQQGYYQLDGTPVRWTFQSDEQYALFQEEHPSEKVEEALIRLEYVGESPLLIWVYAYRFTDADAAAGFFVGIGEREAESTETNPNFVSQPLEPLPGPASDRPTQAFWQSIVIEDSAISGVQTWVQNDRDVSGILFAAPACPPAEPAASAGPADDASDGGGSDAQPPDVTAITTLQVAGAVAADLVDAKAEEIRKTDLRIRDLVREQEMRQQLGMNDNEDDNAQIAECLARILFAQFCVPLLEEMERRIIERGGI